MGYRDSTQIAGSCIAQQECHEEVCKKIPPAMSTGTCDYYKNRHDNYIERHKYDSKSGGDNPPSYYLEYGFKYCSRFKEETYKELSHRGKIWLLDVLSDLQDYMEQGLIKLSFVAKNNLAYNDRHGLPQNSTSFYTGIECRDADFRDFAFATHPDAYNPAVMQTLPAEDLARIALTPDLTEWLSGDTWEQAGVMWDNMDVGQIVEDTANMIIDGAKESINDLIESIRKSF